MADSTHVSTLNFVYCRGISSISIARRESTQERLMVNIQYVKLLQSETPELLIKVKMQ